jgi:hypothetical protein
LLSQSAAYQLKCIVVAIPEHTKIWDGWVVVGFAGRVVLVSIHDGVQREIALSDVTLPDSFDYF